MPGHACKWCDYVAAEEQPDSSTSERFAMLMAHQREEHPDEARAQLQKPKNRTKQKQGKIPAETSNRHREETSTDDGSVKVRLSNEQLTLPNETFLLYHWVRTRFPEYDVTKSEWIQHVIATWAIDHGEEIGLPSIPGFFVNNALGDDEESESEDYLDEDEDEELDDASTEEAFDPVGSWWGGEEQP
jgi:hypothetical protein